MQDQRRTIYYSGRVQGVGFRWGALTSIEGLAVTGQVQNLRDGRVELILEGAASQTLAAAARVRQALARYISQEEVSIGSPTGEFQRMELRG